MNHSRHRRRCAQRIHVFHVDFHEHSKTSEFVRAANPLESDLEVAVLMLN